MGNLFIFKNFLYMCNVFVIKGYYILKNINWVSICLVYDNVFMLLYIVNYF